MSGAPAVGPSVVRLGHRNFRRRSAATGSSRCSASADANSYNTAASTPTAMRATAAANVHRGCVPIARTVPSLRAVAIAITQRITHPGTHCDADHPVERPDARGRDRNCDDQQDDFVRAPLERHASIVRALRRNGETGALCPQSLREAGQPDDSDEDSSQGRPGENAHEHADSDDRNGRHGDPPKRRVSHSVRAYTALLLLRVEPESAPGRNRTYGLALRRRTLYPLSYRRGVSSPFYRRSTQASGDSRIATLRSTIGVPSIASSAPTRNVVGPSSAVTVTR